MHIAQAPSVLALVAANLLPLYLVITGQWTLAEILMLFWLENVIIGVFNVVKMLSGTHGGWLAIPGRLFMSAFFTVHYGMFTLGHGVFLMAFFVGEDSASEMNLSPELIPWVLEHFQLWWPAAVLAASHFVSLLVNYYGRGEYQRLSVSELMIRPYKRVVILHVTIILGAFITHALGQPLAVLVFLLILKIAVDVDAHRREHRFAESEESTDI